MTMSFRTTIMAITTRRMVMWKMIRMMAMRMKMMMMEMEKVESSEGVLLQ